MRAPLLCALLATAAVAAAQDPCTQAKQSDVFRKVRAAQASALSIEAADMDPGIPDKVAPVLIRLKQELARAADVAVLCGPVDATIAQVQARIDEVLHQAAPALPEAKEPADRKDEEKPHKGVFGNQVAAKASLLAETPHLLEVDLSSSENCGDDTQLLIYEEKNGRWQRALRWSSTFSEGENRGHSWGDFTLTKVVTPDPARPEAWRAVFAHGLPWCTSRFSAFGLAVLAPDVATGEAHVVWQTDRGFSRGDFPIRLRSMGDTFELRINADEMRFNEEGFERTVVYRYRVQNDTVTRVQPTALNARGFVEEWLDMPVEEAETQSEARNWGRLKALRERYDASYTEKLHRYTSWQDGPVRACRDGGRFQVEVTSEIQITGQGISGVKSKDMENHFFIVRETGNGYRMMQVVDTPDPACIGVDLMQKPRN